MISDMTMGAGWPHVTYLLICLDSRCFENWMYGMISAIDKSHGADM